MTLGNALNGRQVDATASSPFVNLIGSFSHFPTESSLTGMASQMSSFEQLDCPTKVGFQGVHKRQSTAAMLARQTQITPQPPC